MGDLHQYVIEEDPVRVKPSPPSAPAQKGPRLINLDDRYISHTRHTLNSRPAPLPPTKPKWTGPPNIAIYLSSIELPDLKPKPKVRPNAPLVAQPMPPTASSAPARPPPPKPKPNTPQAVPPRSDRPGGSINGHGPRPSPPDATGVGEGEHRKSSFSRLFGR